MIRFIHRCLEVFNLRGGPLMGLWTLTLIYLTIRGKPIDANAIRAYEIAIAVYGVSKGNVLWVEFKQKEANGVQ